MARESQAKESVVDVADSDALNLFRAGALACPGLLRRLRLKDEHHRPAKSWEDGGFFRLRLHAESVSLCVLNLPSA